MTRFVILSVVAVLLSSCAARQGAVSGAKLCIICPPGSPYQVSLAAREVRRYFYVRTGELLPLGNELSPSAVNSGPGGGDVILIAVKNDPMVAGVADANTVKALADLQPQQYVLKTIHNQDRKVLLVVGGDGQGALYGAYRLAERLGVRFYLHGDVIPDGRVAAQLPGLNEIGKPIFDIRGINPFHDFPEGPDWWSTDDYIAYISQLAKMRMNFIGLHCYPAGAGPEPAVWIGLSSDIGADGRVKAAYPAHWDSTLRPGWGSVPMSTGDFAAGASLLFEGDVFGSPTMEGMMPWARNDEDANKVFDNAGEMFRAGFAHARRLGVKTCVGTETPLAIPDAVCQRLRKLGKDPSTAAVARGVRGHVPPNRPDPRAGLLLAVDARGLDLGRQHAPAVGCDGSRPQGGAGRAGRRGQAFHAGHVRLGAGSQPGPRRPGQGPARRLAHKLHKSASRTRADRSRVRQDRPAAQVGHPLDRERPGPHRAAAVGRADALRRRRGQATWLHRPDRHSLADEDDGPQRLGAGDGSVGPVMGRALPRSVRAGRTALATRFAGRRRAVHRSGRQH